MGLELTVMIKINQRIFVYWYLRNIKHFPCRYTVISTRVESGKTRNYVETRRPQADSVLT